MAFQLTKKTFPVWGGVPLVVKPTAPITIMTPSGPALLPTKPPSGFGRLATRKMAPPSAVRFSSAAGKAAYEKRFASQAVASTGSPVQGFINRILGATPEQPIQIPIRLPPVTVEAAPATQEAMFTNIALLGALGIGIALILRR